MSDVKGRAQKRHHTILAVGEVAKTHQNLLTLPCNTLISYAEINDISAEFITDCAPDIVFSSLVCRHFDFLDLAQALHSAKFNGILKIVTPKLPNPTIVIAEARAMCPSLKIEFISALKTSDKTIN